MSFEDNRPFSISGFGSAFADRQRDLFASLDAAEKEREVRGNPNQPMAVDVNLPDNEDEGRMVESAQQGDRRKKMPLKSFRGKESIFKRPEMPPPRRVRQITPDHQRNPHKWTKYSLGDVSPQDMSERSNTMAALAFIREMQDRKDNEISLNVDKGETLKKPVIFKPRQRDECHTSSSGHTLTVSTSETSEEAERPSFHRSKLVMPEYIVGQKKLTKKRHTKDQGKPGDSKKVVLDHLLDEETE